MRTAAALLLLIVLAGYVVAAQQARDLFAERVPSTPRLPDGKARWALVIGISSYKNIPPAAQLKYAHRDAEDVTTFLRSRQGGSLPAANIRLLTEKNATAGAIRAVLQSWLPQSASANDIVYLFLAGHAVLAEGNEGYFVAHDSDPQNLHATGISFREINQVMSQAVRARLVILFADACHAGGIGWTSDPQKPSQAQAAFESLGGDRSVLKLLASRPSERSFEDARWDGGHGVFTYALLQGLRGDADRDRDGIVNTSELIEHISRVVPEQTGSKQNPRVAGNFEARVPLALLTEPATPAAPVMAALRILGPPGTSVALDGRFRGVIRSQGELRVPSLPPGVYRVAADLPDEGSLEDSLRIAPPEMSFDLGRAPGRTLLQLQALARRGRVLDQGGALEFFRKAPFTPEFRPAAQSAVIAALEDTGQECVNDYVQSTSIVLKRAMLLRSVAAYTQLKTFRPDDKSIEAKRVFCEARAQIAGGELDAAVRNLRASLTIDPNFACAYNALGVALARSGLAAEAQQAFENAARLTPEWSLPYWQIGSQLMAQGKTAAALPYLEKSVKCNPRSTLVHWTLLRAYRQLGYPEEFDREAKALIELDPNYAPTYLEIGTFAENRKDYARATQAFDAYLLLAPKFADSAQTKERAEKNRRLIGRKAPSLLR